MPQTSLSDSVPPPPEPSDVFVTPSTVTELACSESFVPCWQTTTMIRNFRGSVSVTETVWPAPTTTFAVS